MTTIKGHDIATDTTDTWEQSSQLVSNEVDNEYAGLKATSELVVGVIDIVLVPVIVFGNLLVLLSIAKFKSLKSAANIFITSLSCADFLVGLCTLPMYSLLYLSRNFNDMKYPCVLKFVFVLMSLCGSLLSLVLIAYDRYVAVTKPLQYQIIMTRPKARKMVILLWIYTIAVCIVPLFWNYYDPNKQNPCNYFVIFPRLYTAYVSYFSIFILLIVSLFFYIRIFIVAKAYRKKHLHRQVKLGKKSLKQFEKETKSAKFMAMILFLFFAFWIPLQGVGPLGYLAVKQNLVEALKNFALCLAMSNSAVNPIMYCWFRKDFRRAFKKLLCIGKDESEATEVKVKSLYGNQIRSGTASQHPLRLNDITINQIPNITSGNVTMETDSTSLSFDASGN